MKRKSLWRRLQQRAQDWRLKFHYHVTCYFFGCDVDYSDADWSKPFCKRCHT